MKNRALAALALAVALVATGCTAAPAPQTTAGGSSSEPQAGGTLRTTQRYVLPGGLNFLTNPDPGLPGEIGPSYSKLVDFETGPDTVGIVIVPDLADSWEISDDGLTYTFHLNKDAKFHDVPPVNGRDVTADDVVATFRAIIDGKASTAYQFAAVKSIEAPDEDTVVFTLNQVLVPFLENLALPNNYILPVEGINGEYDMDSVLIGSGPFVLKSYDPKTLWHRERNPDYFKAGQPYLDAMDTVIVVDAAARFAALRGGRLDHADIALLEQAQSLADTDDFDMVSQMTGPEMIYFNTSTPPFDDVRVRRAIAMAIDWDGMGKSIRGVYGLTGVVPPALGGLTEDEIRDLRPYDPEAAKKLMEEAGMADGFTTTMIVQQVDGKDVSEAQWIAQDLKEIGIDLQLELTDPATYAARRGSRQFEMARGLRTLLTADQYMAELKSDGGTNFTKVNDPKLDEMLAASRAETDPAARAEIIKEFVKYFETDVATIIPGPITYDNWVWNTKVHNPYTSPDGISPYVIRYGGMMENIWMSE